LINLKISCIAGIIAFTVSFLLGLISGTRIPIVFLKALLFGLGFVVLSGGVYALISMFLPDLFSAGGVANSQDNPGSHVDIAVDDQYGAANPSYFRGDEAKNFDEFGDNQDLFSENIDALPGDGLDQNREDDYTIKGGVGAPGAEPVQGFPLASFSSSPLPASEPKIAAELHTPADSEDTVGSPSEAEGAVDNLPDFDSMAAAFNDFSDGIPEKSGGGEADSGNYIAQLAGASSKKPTPELGEDFDVKEMASAIQTILKREDKG
jgi:hypothetical protein